MQIRLAHALRVCWILLVLVTVVLTSGCNPADVLSLGPTPEPLSVSTTAQLGDNEIIEVELATDNTSQEAGQPAHITYRLRNLSGQRWKGEYCILLTDSQKVVLDAKHQTVDLAAGEDSGGDLKVTLPQNLPSGIYNLDILVPGEGHQGIPIAVGRFTLSMFPSVNVPPTCPK